MAAGFSTATGSLKQLKGNTTVSAEARLEHAKRVVLVRLSHISVDQTSKLTWLRPAIANRGQDEVDAVSRESLKPP